MFQHPFRITVQPGRLGSESVDALARNSRTPSPGMGGRLRRITARASARAFPRGSKGCGSTPRQSASVLWVCWLPCV